MRCIKGFRDIKTHGSLAREGKLISVARDWHKYRRSSDGNSTQESWDGRVENHLYKSGPWPVQTKSLFSDFYLGEKIRKYQTEFIQGLLEELRQASAEGISVLTDELEHLEKKLAKLKAG